MTLRTVWFFISICALADSQLTNCPRGNIHFVKNLGLRPPQSAPPLLLFRGDSRNLGITGQCIEQCQNNSQCRSFVLFYNASTCYWYRNAIDGAQEVNSEADVNAAWFVKVCLQAGNCTKSWIFERVPGATLVGNNTKVLPNAYTRTECQQSCLNETQFDCKSVKFKIKNSYGPSAETTGICVLSDADRHIFPSSFRASLYDDEYLENQCSDDNYDHIDGDFCSYEEYDNSTLQHIDFVYENKSKRNCQDLCEKSQDFNCRGYSVVLNNSQTNCYLHSEDSKVHGPKLLQETAGGKYFEKAPCLNISISCSETYMSVRFAPRTRFSGRLYMNGHYEQPECYVKGSGTNVLTLKLSLLSTQCGLIKARTGSSNRTLIGGTMILQYNDLVQTQGDRVIRVGCTFGNDSKVLAGTGITISSGPSHGSPLIQFNNSSTPPGVEMRVVDLNTQQEVSSTEIGQELQLIIELNPSDGSLDLWASHLVAMSAEGNESIVLLDDMGCPTNLDIFPAFTKIETNSSRKLVATFHAFKFSSSPIVRFSVIVQFCPQTCPPMTCDETLISRQRRDADLQTIDGTKVTSVNRTDFDKNAVRMPLEFYMVVRNPQGNSERLVLSDGKILVAGYDYITHEVCLDYSLFIGLLVTWVLIQIIFVVCCLVIVRRYKQYYESQSISQSLEHLNKNFGFGFGNLDNRRVHWADHEEFT